MGKAWRRSTPCAASITSATVIQERTGTQVLSETRSASAPLLLRLRAGEGGNNRNVCLCLTLSAILYHCERALLAARVNRPGRIIGNLRLPAFAR